MKPTREEVEKSIKQVLKDISYSEVNYFDNVDLSKTTVHLKDDLGLDSLDRIEAIMELEKIWCKDFGNMSKWPETYQELRDLFFQALDI